MVKVLHTHRTGATPPTVLNADQVFAAMAHLPSSLSRGLAEKDRYKDALAENPYLDAASFRTLCQDRLPATRAEALARSARTPGQVSALLATGERRITPLSALLDHARPSAQQLEVLAGLKLSVDVASYLLRQSWQPTPAHLMLAKRAEPDMVSRYLINHLDEMDDETATVFAVEAANRCAVGLNEIEHLAAVLWQRPQLAEAVLATETRLAIASLACALPGLYQKPLVRIVLDGLLTDEASMWAAVASTLAFHPEVSTRNVKVLWDAVSDVGLLSQIINDRIPPPHMRPCTKGVPLSEVTDPDVIWGCALLPADGLGRIAYSYIAAELAQNPNLDATTSLCVSSMFKEARYCLPTELCNAATKALRERFPDLKIRMERNYRDRDQHHVLGSRPVVVRRPVIHRETGTDDLAASIHFDDPGWWSFYKDEPNDRVKSTILWIEDQIEQLATGEAKHAAWSLVLEFARDRRHGSVADLLESIFLLIA